MKTKLGVLMVASAVAWGPGGTADAGNWSHPVLDRAASEVAGKPVTVWCEDNIFDWDRAVTTFTGGSQIGAGMYGFTYSHTPVVFLSPQRCLPLRFAIDYGYQEVGVIYLAAGLHTLAHEAAHQRGYADEGQAECFALPLIPAVAERHFGVARTVTVPQPQTVTRTMRRKVAGKWRTFRYQTQVVVPTVTANPDYGRLVAWASAWHRSLPANYQGGC